MSDRKETVQNMLLDEKINQVLSAYKKPLTAASFYIQPAVDEKGESSPQDIANDRLIPKTGLIKSVEPEETKEL